MDMSSELRACNVNHKSLHKLLPGNHYCSLLLTLYRHNNQPSLGARCTAVVLPARAQSLMWK
jgi:hypothetical protein